MCILNPRENTKMPVYRDGFENEICCKGDQGNYNQIICLPDNFDVPRFRLRFCFRLIFLTIVLGLNLLFFRYLCKLDAQAQLRLHFEHIYVAFSFSDFPGKLPLCGKSE